MKHEPLKSFSPIWTTLADALPGGKVSRRSKERFCSKSYDPHFNMVEMPDLGKCIYRSFKTGYLPKSEFFRYRNNRPVFLKELFAKCYEADGSLRDVRVHPRIVATFRKLLQLLMVFYKYEDYEALDNTDALVSQFQELQSSRATLLDGAIGLGELSLISKAKVLIMRVLGNYDPRDIKPFHGSGVVKTGEENWNKWMVHPYYPGIQHLYPDDEFMFASYSHLCDEWLSLENRETISEISVRLTSVPKNSQTRRMIAVEEAYIQYIKLGLMTLLYKIIESHPLTKGYVNFTSQETNRQLAKIASETSSLCTLDLSAASDSVYVDLVRRLFPRNWVEALLSTRATKACYKDLEFPLHTFATMGSATCFPVEALVFWAVTSACVGHTCNYVYGDDIICENDSYSEVADALSSLGFSVNEAKSYSTGLFRESCGADFLNGQDLTVEKLRHDPRRNRNSIIQFINNINEKYGESVSAQLYTAATSLTGFLPLTSDKNLSGLAVYRNSCLAANDCFLRRRYNHALQRYEYRVKTWVPSVKKGKNPWFETMRSLSQRGHRSISGAYDVAMRLKPVWRWVALG